MFLAQLAGFLSSHHHAMWVSSLNGSVQIVEWLIRWAVHHGFVYQP